MNEFKILNEKLEKLFETKGKYILTIITGRDRDSIGDVTKKTFNAKNDLDALLYVFKNYNLQNAGMFNGDYEEDELEEDQIELKNNILKCVKEGKIQEGIELLTDLYFDNFDISDYYDDIVCLEGPNGIIIEDDIDLSDWDDDELDTEDYEDQFDKADSISDTENNNKEKFIERAKEQQKLVNEMLKEFEKPLESKDSEVSFKGVNTYLNLPGKYWAVASIQSNSDATALNVEVFGPKDAYHGKKFLNDASIDEVKQFLLDNYAQMEERTRILDKGIK